MYLEQVHCRRIRIGNGDFFAIDGDRVGTGQTAIIAAGKEIQYPAEEGFAQAEIFRAAKRCN
ncbi:MAG: hypothetical protein JMN24_07085 [gamma proteobacterium endosymbiont of Lamellibrachia anaximandri]|nr:hypothetical protein [gamma proteobacterium endosymbiont of Lamellibrachia anaximandri]MBL3619482.1 hypothetical protein [gamma proteobacterium endosymbiont of Lamellibrachia anaximandri]